MLVGGLSAAIVAGYGAALWWLLRREAPAAICFVAALSALSLSLRLVDNARYPPGINDDEAKQVDYASGHLPPKALFGLCVQGPCLLSALFQAPLTPLVGPNRWAIRSYSLVTSVLSTAVVFALARALQMQLASSLGAAALIAVLPWSVYFGRVSLGGEIVFHQLLVLAALARLVWGRGGWPEVAIGGLGSCLLLYDYPGGWATLGMPVVAALLAQGRRQRLMCLAVPILALLGWSPYLHFVRWEFIPGLSAVGLDREMGAQLPARLWAKTSSALHAFILPTARDEWLSIAAAALHPRLVLALAIVGGLSFTRRTVFLWAGFVGGLLPTVVSWGVGCSTHRMLTAYPFVALAASAALDRIPFRRPRVAMTVAAVAVISVQSILLFFSPMFWPPRTVSTFSPYKTAIMEALPSPPHPPIVAMRQFDPQLKLRARTDPNQEELSVENWYPRSGASVYAFSPISAPLRPFYEHLFGPDRVEVHGGGFIVTLEAKDWSWMRQHGWVYEARCDGRHWRAQVPTLVHIFVTFRDLRCRGTVTQTWRGRWLAAPATLRLGYSGNAAVETPTARVVGAAGFVRSVDFAIARDQDITVTISTIPGANLNAALMEITPAGQSVPTWDSVDPVWDELPYAVEPQHDRKDAEQAVAGASPSCEDCR